MDERKKLSESEEQLKFVLAGGQLGFWDWDITSGEVQRNARWAEMLGYTLEEVESSESQWPDLIHEEDRAGAWQSIEDHLAGKTSAHKIEYRMRTKDGQYKWILDQAQVVARDEEGRPLRMSGTHTDVTERRRSEEAFRRLNQQLRASIDQMPIGYILWDMKFRVLEWNASAERIFGYSRAELLGKSPVYYIVPEAARSQVREVVEKLLHGEEASFSQEGNNLRKDGSEISCLWYNTPLKDNAGTTFAVLSMVIDVTERRDAEEALRDSEKRSRTYLEYSPACTKIVDLDFNLQYMSSAGVKSLGIDDITAYYGKQYPFDFYPDSSRTQMLKNLKKVKETGEIAVQEASVVDLDGNELWFHSTLVPVNDDNGQIDYIMVVSIDITERKVAEKALRESEERYLSLADASFEGLLIHDKGKIIDANARFQEMFGYTREELVAMRSYELVAPEDRERVQQGIADENENTYEVLGLRKDSSVFPVELQDRHMQYRGACVRVVACQDITERKHAVAENEKLEAQLRQSQKMEAVGQLAGGIAHDFNNLLQAILGYGTIALEQAGEDSPVGESVEEVLKAGERARVLVRQLLAFSRQQVLDMKDLNLNDLVAMLMNMIRRVIGEHITLNILAGHDLGTVHADWGQIEQILTNLCVNARDAMPEGGSISIETENVLIDGAFCETHVWAEPGRYVLLSVTDTGCGMDAEIIEQVFDPFFTTKGVGKGTGLGLSTVYGLVKQHHGMVHVYSEVGKGSTFKIYLPLVERSAGSVGDKIEGPVAGGTETILLAEDEEMVRNLTKMILERAGYTVLEACDGEEALRVLEEHSGVVDLAFLDVVMPKLGGRAVYQRLSASRPELRFLFASGYSMNAVHTNFVLDDGLALIQKPYLRTGLLRRIRVVLDGGDGVVE